MEVKANFIAARRCRLYADREQSQLVGRLQIAGSGTYARHYHKETWKQKVTYTKTDKEGNKTRHTKWVHRSKVTDTNDSDLQHMYWKMVAYGQSFNIYYNEASSGSWLKAATLTFQCVSDSGMPLFRVVSNGSSSATVETFSSSDPVNAILAAFAVSLKMEPKEFKKVVEGNNERSIPLQAQAGYVSGFGLNDAEYEAAFPTAGEMVVPPMGFAFGVQAEEIGDIPMAMPVGEPFTPMAVPVGEWAPPPVEAVPLVMPVVTQGIVLEEYKSDGESDAGDMNDDGELTEGDEDGDEGADEEAEEEVDA
jgi:hypothetical protein